MPIEKSTLFGDLYVVIIPEFPEYIDETSVRKIRKIFVEDKHLIYLKKPSNNTAISTHVSAQSHIIDI
jgi:hypothetical protein